MIKIKKIHSMQWGDESKNSVLLIADTNTGDFETISTAYNANSIIWVEINTFPIDRIAAYVELPFVDDLQSEQIQT